MIETFIYLINSRFGCADFEFTQDFPLLASYRIEDKEDDAITKKPMKVLTLEFKKGSLSFVFEKVFHAISEIPLGKQLR